MNSKPLILAGLLTVSLALSACGNRPGERALSGGLIGAGGGAAVGGIIGGGGGALTGALIGGAVGAGTGALTSPRQVDLGDPIWR